MFVVIHKCICVCRATYIFTYTGSYLSLVCFIPRLALGGLSRR